MDAKPFRYVGALPVIVPSTSWERAVDAYVVQVVGLVREAGAGPTNLDRAWEDVRAERADATLAEQRRLEAMLGRDPDDVEDGAVERLLADAERLGRGALGEIAASSARAKAADDVPLTAKQFDGLAQQRGHGAVPRLRHARSGHRAAEGSAGSGMACRRGGRPGAEGTAAPGRRQ